MLLTVLYFALLGVLVYSLKDEKFKSCYTALKTCTSITFLVLAIVRGLSHNFDRFLYVFPALICCAVGDIILACYYTNQKSLYLKCGFLSFVAAHCFFIMMLLHYTYFKYCDLILSAVMVFIMLYATELPRFDTGKLKNYIIGYSFIVMLFVSKSVDLFFSGISLSTALLAIGSLLFVVSDVILYFLYFDTTLKHKALYRGINLVFYYISIFIIIMGI